MCSQGNIPLVKCPVREIATRANVCWGNVKSQKCQSEMCQLGKCLDTLYSCKVKIWHKGNSWAKVYVRQVLAFYLYNFCKYNNFKNFFLSLELILWAIVAYFIGNPWWKFQVFMFSNFEIMAKKTIFWPIFDLSYRFAQSSNESEIFHKGRIQVKGKASIWMH